MAYQVHPSQRVFMDDLPNEVLEYILTLLSPYEDYKSALLVCHRWHDLMIGIAVWKYDRFLAAVDEGTLCWSSVNIRALQPLCTITERYSHSSCYLKGIVYVFGGCTSKNTTFNDIWKLDLQTREWYRPLAMGRYPVPKAYASLVVFEDKLVLFGGWSNPSPMAIHQNALFFRQLHFFTPENNRWEEIFTNCTPPGLAGHGASVVRHSMIVFGGAKDHGISCNEIWVFNLVEHEWTSKTVEGKKPLPRYGHAQKVIDDLHIVVVGGCGGPNKQFSDVWLLTMDPAGWSWEEITVSHPENCAPHLWCHPACKVADKMLFLSKLNKSSSKSPSQNSMPQIIKRSTKKEPVHCFCCQHAKLDDQMTLQSKRRYPETSESSSQESSSDNDDTAANRFRSAPGRGRSFVQRHTFGSRKPTSFGGKGGDPEPSTSKDDNSSMSPPALPGESGPFPRVRSGLPSIRPNAMRNRQKQLEMLNRHEERIKAPRNKETKRVHSKEDCCKNSFGFCKIKSREYPLSDEVIYIYTLDLSEILSERTVGWMPLTDYSVNRDSPKETVFYSFVEGRAELIMFGGISTDLNNFQYFAQSKETYTNMVYFLHR